MASAILNELDEVVVGTDGIEDCLGDFEVRFFCEAVSRLLSFEKFEECLNVVG